MLLLMMMIPRLHLIHEDALIAITMQMDMLIG
jgi:hypothetical protein